jgi:hypothetical protein
MRNLNNSLITKATKTRQIEAILKMNNKMLVIITNSEIARKTKVTKRNNKKLN